MELLYCTFNLAFRCHRGHSCHIESDSVKAKLIWVACYTSRRFTCSQTVTYPDNNREWHDEIRYLGVYITSSNVYSCSFRHSKQAVYCSFNAIFGKVGRIASEKVVLELFKKSICLCCCTALRLVR